VERFPRARSTFRLLYDSAQSWIDKRALRLGAGVAYYGLFALVPVLFLALAIATFFLGQAVRQEVEGAITGHFGGQLGQALLDAIDSIEIGGSTVLGTLIGLGVVMFTATLLFVAWKEVVDLLWGIPRERGIRATLARRLFGLTAVLGAGALLTLNLAIETIIGFFDQFFDGPLLDALVRIGGSFAVLALGALFIGILFRYTPDVDVSWRHVWFAAAICMAMLVVGAWGYGLYLRYVSLTSAFSVAGALLLGLVLVYYAIAILLYGMEIVHHAHTETRFVPLAFMSLAHQTSGAERPQPEDG
jgi:membrane protein